VKFTKFF